MANIEGESLKKMASASSTPGALSAITGWMTARKSKDSGSSKKTGIDYHNEEVARQKEHARSEESKSSDLNRTIELGRINKKEDLGVQSHQSGEHKASLYPRQVPASKAKSSNGQGTSGNTKGPQFAKSSRVTGKPSRENKVPSVGSMVPSAEVKTAVEPAITPTKPSRRTGKPTV